jgi:Na+-translocating ferredoxin:NAD+ oxidoreductase subunit G
MAKLESSFKNMVLVLSVITLFAAMTLASVYSFTKEPIALSKIAKQQKAIQDVLPASFDHLAEPISIEDGNELLIVNKAYDKNDNFIGAAVQSSSNNGFSGRIVVMVGFDAEGTIVDYAVLEQKETPGLGTKMVDWFKTDKGNQNIKGKNAGTSNLTVANDGGEVDAITAATISSRAFLYTVRSAYHAFSLNMDEAVASQSDSISSVINN